MSREARSLEKPYRYKHWLIWPRTVLGQMDISDCDDTIGGVCLKGKTIQECIDECVGDCAAGLHAEFKDGETICVPIRTALHPSVNPAFRMRRQDAKSTQSGLNKDGVTMSVFINIDVWPFPPDLGNTVFYRDIVSLRSATKDLALETKNVLAHGKGPLRMGKGAVSHIRLDLVGQTSSAISEMAPVIYGDPILLVIPGTSFMGTASTLAGQGFLWQSILGTFEGSNFTFMLIPLDKGRTFGEYVTYGDKFALAFGGTGIIEVDENGYFDLRPSSLLPSLTNKKYAPDFSVVPDSARFTFTSHMTVYYCDEGECKPVPQQDITRVSYPESAWSRKVVYKPGQSEDTKSGRDRVTSSPLVGLAAVYKGHTVLTSPGCYGICKYIKPGRKDEGSSTLPGDEHLALDSFLPPSSAERPSPPNKKGIFIGVVLLILGVILAIVVVVFLRRRQQN